MEFGRGRAKTVVIEVDVDLLAMLVWCYGLTRLGLPTYPDNVLISLDFDEFGISSASRTPDRA